MGTFSDDYDPTQDDAYRTRVTIDAKSYILEFIDSSSRESSSSLRQQTISNSDATLLVYSITSPSTLSFLINSHRTIKEIKTQEGMWDPFQICILGNKCDLEDERRVPTEQGRYFAGRLGCAFEECSAKTSENAEKAAHDLVRRIITYRDNERIRYEQIQEKAVKDTERKMGRKDLWKKMFKYVQNPPFICYTIGSRSS